MLAYIWPLALVVVSNTVYHVCAKSVPDDMNPLAAVTVTYLVAALFTGVLYFVLNRGGSLTGELRRINWAPILLGFVIVGLEVGSIYVYKAGWPISIAYILESAFIAIALIFVGYFLYKEGITWNKLLGAAVCLGGLALMNFNFK